MTAGGTGRTRRLAAAVAALLSAVAAALVVVPAPASAINGRPAVVEQRVIGHSVKGRPIIAYRVGNPASTNKVVVMSTIHGNEPRIRMIPAALRDGRKITGVDLWLIPIANPDGFARGTRKNAHGVDLNRNFPYRWARLTGNYNSGTSPASEPETKALIRFFGQIRPRRVVSFHQPLHGVDVSTPAARTFARRLANGLNLPRKNLTCGGVCHGTFTEWYIHQYPGVAVTVEYGPRPSRHRMKVTAPRQLLRVLDARRP